MSKSFNLEKIETLWVLGLLSTDELPNLAAEALAHGLQSKSLVELAGCSPAESDDIRRLFNQSLREITGKRRLLKTDALRNYARQIATSILTSEVSPLEGARLIWRATLKAGVQGFHELDGFIYAASELEDRPKDKELFEKAITEEAKRWSERDCLD